MKTTLDLPDEVLKNAKASAATRGETLRDFVTAALKARLRDETTPGGSAGGWRRAFGGARRADVASVDRIVSHELETIEADDWR